MRNSFLMVVLFATVLFIPLTVQGTYIDTVELCKITDSDESRRVLSWMHFSDGSAFSESLASLSIVAEDIDFLMTWCRRMTLSFNAYRLGELVRQTFSVGGFDIMLGPGAWGNPRGELAASIFSVDIGTPS